MQLHDLVLVTVIGETVIMNAIAKEGLALGASGYTLTEVLGKGSRGVRNAIITGGPSTMKCEFVVPNVVAEAILTHVSHTYFEHYACIAWVSDARVMRGEAYIEK